MGEVDGGRWRERKGNDCEAADYSSNPCSDVFQHILCDECGQRRTEVSQLCAHPPQRLLQWSAAALQQRLQEL